MGVLVEGIGDWGSKLALCAKNQRDVKNFGVGKMMV